MAAGLRADQRTSQMVPWGQPIEHDELSFIPLLISNSAIFQFFRARDFSDFGLLPQERPYRAGNMPVGSLGGRLPTGVWRAFTASKITHPATSSDRRQNCSTASSITSSQTWRLILPNVFL